MNLGEAFFVGFGRRIWEVNGEEEVREIERRGHDGGLVRVAITIKWCIERYREREMGVYIYKYI